MHRSSRPFLITHCRKGPHTSVTSDKGCFTVFQITWLKFYCHSKLMHVIVQMSTAINEINQNITFLHVTCHTFILDLYYNFHIFCNFIVYVCMYVLLCMSLLLYTYVSVLLCIYMCMCFYIIMFMSNMLYYILRYLVLHLFSAWSLQYQSICNRSCCFIKIWFRWDKCHVGIIGSFYMPELVMAVQGGEIQK
jgi:hypothetical protein